MEKQQDFVTMGLRSKRCICRHCGSKLEIRMIIFCQYGGQGLELYCPKCERIEYGIEPEIYQLAREFAEDYQFNYYLEMAEDERSYQLNIAKIGELFGWLFNRLKLCDGDGFTADFKPFIKRGLCDDSAL